MGPPIYQSLRLAGLVGNIMPSVPWLTIDWAVIGLLQRIMLQNLQPNTYMRCSMTSFEIVPAGPRIQVMPKEEQRPAAAMQRASGGRQKSAVDVIIHIFRLQINDGIATFHIVQ